MDAPTFVLNISCAQLNVRVARVLGIVCGIPRYLAPKLPQISS